MLTSAREGILKSIKDGIDAVSQLQSAEAIFFIEAVANCLASAFKAGNKVLIAGNGGSLCDASHFAEELTGQFRHYRAALPAISLSEPGHLSCVGNDMGFSEVFARGVEAFGQEGDVFVGLSTSGNSENIIRAFEVAKAQKLHTVAFLGKGGGKLKGFADHELSIDGFQYSDRVQEAHMTAIHVIIEMIEHQLFPENSL